MNSNTKSSKKTSPTTWNEKPLNFTLTLNDVEESLELTPREQALFERWENEHLAYADIDLHY
ncbi:hypothetical protein [Crocosphaera chwakensis]|uniref:Uncharacterized protein n=1 Tax=Crocosphaera chwakensis CCY0110 TaxID=391612 RepID=A3IY33_9CHRO|nr:hypothetical protein [Crocosphaera chwakensis]EAZ88609.1 hypothetical protein CY0110_31430 [Crocosphaera chwakensis CCY0110]